MLWVLISIICPLVLPVFCMLGLKAVPAFAPNAKLMAPVKDGQLCWGALAMCLSAMYEALFPGQTSTLGNDGRAMAILQFAILLIFSSLIAAGGAIAPTPLAIPAGTPWYRHYRTFVASLVLTAWAGVGYTMVHFKSTG